MLLVSAHPARPYLLARLLSTAGYAVAVAADDHAAMELAAVEAPAVFVIDFEAGHRLAGDGTLLSYIRSNPVADLREAAVILLTAPHHTDRSPLVGAADALHPVPVHAADLQATVRRLLELGPSRRMEQRRIRLREAAAAAGVATVDLRAGGRRHAAV